MPDNSRLEQLEQKIDRLCGIIVAAQNYMHHDPEAALVKARNSAEAICREIYKQEFRNTPKKESFDKIVNKLKAENHIPREIFTHLRTVQWYGNLGAHVDLDVELVNSLTVNPCLAALMNVTHWYFKVYLNGSVPTILEKIEDEPDSSPLPLPSDNPINFQIKLPYLFYLRAI